MLLRPFFRPPMEEGADVMDPETWTLDDKTGWFPGTFKTQSQRLSRVSHPHLKLEECLVHMPKVNPGDTVWWHCDVSSEPLRHSSSICYIWLTGWVTDSSATP
jgi:hypothetical protein